MKRLERLLGLEWLVVIAAAPLLTFPTVRPRWAVGALGVLDARWLVSWMVRGEPRPVTAFNGALLVFALTIPVGVWASAFPELTVPAATRLVATSGWTWEGGPPWLAPGSSRPSSPHGTTQRKAAETQGNGGAGDEERG